MLIRGAMGRKLPYGKVNAGDKLYFIENNGEGLIKAKATVENTFNSPQLTTEESVSMVEKYQDKLMLDQALKKRFSGKRYLVLITIKEFELIENFSINRTEYGNMDDWLPVGEIDTVKLKG